jgi:hypothetical protein
MKRTGITKARTRGPLASLITFMLIGLVLATTLGLLPGTAVAMSPGDPYADAVVS